MHSLLQQYEQKFKKTEIPVIRSGNTVRVAQRIVEGKKERIQSFEGLVIRTRRMNSLSADITVRRVASGVGVEKTFRIHAPSVEKIEVVRQGKVRRNYLSYMRERAGKSARLKETSASREATIERNKNAVAAKRAKSEAKKSEKAEKKAAPAKTKKTEAKESSKEDK